MPYTVRGTQVPVVIALASFLSPESTTAMLGISELQCLVVSSCLVCEFMTVVVVAWSALRLRYKCYVRTQLRDQDQGPVGENILEGTWEGPGWFGWPGGS